MAFSLIQKTSKDSASSTTHTLAYGSNNTAGNSLMLQVRIGGTSQTITVSDSQGNTWAQDVAPVWIGGLGSVSAFSAHNVKAGANTVTITLGSSATTARFFIEEYNPGAANVGAFDAGVQNNGSGSTLDSTNATPTTTTSVAIGFAGNNSAATFTAGTGFGNLDQVPAAPNARAGFEDQLLTTTTALDATFPSGGAAGGWACLIAIYKAVASGITITPTQGAATLAGLAAVMSLGMTPSTGSVAFQGYAPVLVRTSPAIAPPPGSASFQGYPPVVDYDIPPTPGALAFAGQAPTIALSSSRVITPGNATLTLTGPAVSQAWTDLTGLGSAAWQGYSPVVSVSTSGSTQISPQQADMAFTGYAVSQLLTLLPPAPAVLAFQGYAPFLGGNIISSPTQAALAFQGYAPILGLPTQTGSVSWQGQASALNYSIGGGTPAALAFTGQAPIVTYSGLTTPGTLSFQGYAPVVSNQFILTPQTGTLSFNGTVSRISFLAASPGSLAFNGLAPTVTNSAQHVLTNPHYMQRFPIGTDGTVQCVDVTRAVPPFVFWNENKVDTNGRLMVVVDGLPAGWDDGLQVTASECIIVTRNPVGPSWWTDGLQLDSRGFLCVTDNPTLPVFNMQGMQFDSNGYLVVTIG